MILTIKLKVSDQTKALELAKMINDVCIVGYQATCATSAGGRESLIGLLVSSATVISTHVSQERAK